MQGNKKCTDGFSDSSSIGSVLDDADREVSNLTDRAFRSLCISEDASFHDSNLALSPEVTHRGFGPLYQNTVSHARRKSGIWSQLPSQGTEHTGWAATFQQQPKYVQGEDKYPKSSPPLTPAQQRLEVPVSGLRSSHKPVSKVSSLIKSFDRTESQHCDSRLPPSKPPALKNPPKFAPLPDSSVNFCFDSAFLTVRRVPAEVSSAQQSSHQPTWSHGEQGSPQNPEMAHHDSSSFLSKPDSATSSFESSFPSPAHHPAKMEPGRGQEWAHKRTFLHSENSAFESWDTHQPKLFERKNVAESMPESKVPKHYEDKPPIREAHDPQHKVSPCPVRPSCAQENRSASRALSISGPQGVRDPGSQVFLIEGKAASSHPDPQVRPSQPPWRKPKTSRGRKENLADVVEEQKQTHKRGPALYTKHNTQAHLTENDAMDMPEDLDQHYSPPFNISKLLTPVIPTKHALESSDNWPEETSPSPPGKLNGYQEQEQGEHPLRDSYKSKAPSLLFNLKDVRKCVKSMYSPSPLSKGFDEKSQGKAGGKQEPVSNGVMLPNGLEESPPNELFAERPAEAPTASHTGSQNPTANQGEGSVHNLGSPPTVATAPFCVNGKAAGRSGEEKDAVGRESEPGSSKSTWHPDSRGQGPRKHLSLKLCTREPEAEAGEAAEQTKPHPLENGLSRSISQGAEPKRETGLLRPWPDQKASPGPLSPEEEEDVFYSDSQSDFMPGLRRKTEFSTSSSDPSFASFDDQQKMGFSESQRENRKNDLSAGDSEKEKKEYVTGTGDILSNGHTYVGEHSQSEVPQSTGGLCAGSPRRASTEEATLSSSQMGVNRDSALSQAKGPTHSPSPAASKHLLFTIKDNTLRATPVIRPIILPLLRTLSSEDSFRGGHREEESPRQGWGENAGGRNVLNSREMPTTPIPANTWGARSKRMPFEVPEDPGQVSTAAGADTSQPDPEETFSPLPLVGEGNRTKSPSDGAPEVVARNGRSRPTDWRRLAAPRHIPTIAFPEGDLEEQSSWQTPAIGWEEPMQSVQGHFLSAPRAGPLGRRLVLGERATSPNPSSLGESSACSPAASSLWDDTSQAPGDLGLLPEEPPSSASPWAPGPARLAHREDLTHGLMWEPDSSDPQCQLAMEDLRPPSPGGSLLDSATGPKRPEPPTQLERAAGKPPAVPPKTEKALRRAKKLANKRRKSDQVAERLSEAREGQEGTVCGPQAFGEGPQLPAVHALPPPAHRHSVSGIVEPIGRRLWEAQPLAPLPPYPAMQKVLQDPQSGEYFVFDLPLQVRIKTFYDPETGKYIKVSVPASERASPEPPGQDALAEPYLLYPGLRPVPITTLRPLRCSSQLSAPTFLGQSLHSRPYSAHDTGPQCNTSPPKGTQHPRGPHRGPEDEKVEAPGLAIISTDDLEDFATEGIS
ncbi:uncharacterized protein C10orf71 homolog [Heterocephalus glaber]|uniref:Uncharacterized protein C10orf71 homolog n=1 Tax=Heterocephalus glaber TaxID=10181 RepID=A0AAX6SFP1_HETGA|nr:uncharacterized protein C10orf71 homolog [Heterocephalus glaber]XP_021107614.1 uncharacterized protein C10orf71 homolog [Heterocephalus glaber]XP_021107615.1 uncharacterized protein C10orf71 homolog [Heterocephalus glaber]XP_021107616.1 uncharacterized protein C10orf71 homolog [Heterocephalus glaber]XP_021107617.1 uncharacterized protein C10orf71 homolog [Heterocephalus glaber]